MKILNLKHKEIITAFINGEVIVGVYGLGKMGLPLAAVFADRGAKIIGVDVSPQVVSMINNGDCPIAGEPGLAELVKFNVKELRLRATTDGENAVKESDVHVIIVPSLLDENYNPQLTMVTDVCSVIASGLSKGDLVILETTVPPRTTIEIILPILQQSGLKDGDFGLAYCPERTSSGRAISDISGAYPKIIGGIDKRSTEVAVAIYSVINKKGTRAVSNTTTAEAIKVFEGIYRDTNIALSNELALVCREIGINPAEVFKLANEPINAATGHPYTNFLQPGAGVGGHCIPVYPYFITKNVSANTSLIQTARKINESMPTYVVNLIIEGLNEIERSVKGSNILLLGLTYRGGVKEVRYSPTIPIIKKLKRLQASVSLYDPMFSMKEIESYGVSYHDNKDYRNIDCVVVLSDHREFYNLDWLNAEKEMRSQVIVDGRQVIDPNHVQKLGFLYKGIGNIA